MLKGVWISHLWANGWSDNEQHQNRANQFNDYLGELDKHNVTISYFAQQQTQSPQKAVTTLLKKETTTYGKFLKRENVMEKS